MKAKELKHSHNVGALKSFPHCPLSGNIHDWGTIGAENSPWMREVMPPWGQALIILEEEVDVLFDF